MVKRDKRLSKIRQNPKHVSKDELERLLVNWGFVQRGGKGSHTVYQHRDEETPIVVAAHGKHVPTYIVRQVLNAIDRIIERETLDDREND
jgi:predicted RNA binding protein YcfA (HicA-like mRNA interferase family)